MTHFSDSPPYKQAIYKTTYLSSPFQLGKYVTSPRRKEQPPHHWNLTYQTHMTTRLNTPRRFPDICQALQWNQPAPPPKAVCIHPHTTPMRTLFWPAPDTPLCAALQASSGHTIIVGHRRGPRPGTKNNGSSTTAPIIYVRSDEYRGSANKKMGAPHCSGALRLCHSLEAMQKEVLGELCVPP